jgi:hypothetical protein
MWFAGGGSKGASDWETDELGLRGVGDLSMRDFRDHPTLLGMDQISSGSCTTAGMKLTIWRQGYREGGGIAIRATAARRWGDAAGAASGKPTARNYAAQENRYGGEHYRVPGFNTEREGGDEAGEAEGCAMPIRLRSKLRAFLKTTIFRTA